MNISISPRSVLALATGLFIVLSSGCVVSDGGYGYSGGYPTPGYYEPYGAYYGGWGPNYLVAPYYQQGSYRSHPATHALASHHFRSAPDSRVAPSIPSQGRSETWRR